MGWIVLPGCLFWLVALVSASCYLIARYGDVGICIVSVTIFIISSVVFHEPHR